MKDERHSLPLIFHLTSHILHLTNKYPCNYELA